MKAIRLIEPGRPLEMQDVAVPAVGADEVLVRVEAAGVCRSDVHYRAGVSPVRPLPLTLGHEVAGVVEQAGSAASNVEPGDRVCVHYLTSCRRCAHCAAGREQFCVSGSMIGKYRDGGFADYICVPARNAVPLPDEIPFEQGAIMMCSSATAFHALNRAGVEPGDRVAVFGVGGLGTSAIQLARAVGATQVFAVDVDPVKLRIAEALGAVPIDNTAADAAQQIERLTDGAGVNVALELIGLPATTQQAIAAAGIAARVVVVGLSDTPVAVDTYADLIGRELSLIGCNDHLLTELPSLIDFVRRGALDLSPTITGTIPLDADAVNAALDDLEAFAPGTIRTVVKASD